MCFPRGNYENEVHGVNYVDRHSVSKKLHKRKTLAICLQDFFLLSN